jgi:hypothetical protein
VLIASITVHCVADHQDRPEALEPWLANKTPEGVRKWFANPRNRLFATECDGALAAVGSFNLDREIILNYVSPEHRFVGASSALLEAMEHGLRSGEARLTSTGTAHRFYRARGWVDAGEPERDGGMLAYPMRKVLG